MCYWYWIRNAHQFPAFFLILWIWKEKFYFHVFIRPAISRKEKKKNGKNGGRERRRENVSQNTLRKLDSRNQNEILQYFQEIEKWQWYLIGYKSRFIRYNMSNYYVLNDKSNYYEIKNDFNCLALYNVETFNSWKRNQIVVSREKLSSVVKRYEKLFILISTEAYRKCSIPKLIECLKEIESDNEAMDNCNRKENRVH